jgi:tRNA dimethylallyltransferase
MLYFKALLHGLSEMPEADPATRAGSTNDAAERRLAGHARRTGPRGPGRRASHPPHRRQRIQRALEVWRLSGRPISDWQQCHRRQPFPWRVLKLVVCPADRSVLHQRIAQRFDAMLEAGFLDEVRRLRADARLHPGQPAMRAVGYRQAWEYLDGEGDLDSLRQRGIAATRQLAKRQLTWLRAQFDARWLDPATQSREIEAAVDDFLGG